MMDKVQGPRVLLHRAVRDALDWEMAQDPRVFVMGEDVAVFGSVFQVAAGLLEKYGSERVRDTPISESGFISAAVGAAMSGMKPVVELMFIDFVGVCLDPIYNMAAKNAYHSGGAQPVPMVIMTGIGGGYADGSQHSQSLFATFAHLPGLKVVVPSNAYDARGLMHAAIADPNPVVFMFHKKLTGMGWFNPVKTAAVPVPRERYEVPIGKAFVRRSGTDITLVGWSVTVHQAMDAAEMLARDGISAEVIDLASLVPMDIDTVIESVRKTGHLIVVDEDYRNCGVAGEVIARVVERDIGMLKGPPQRICFPDVPIPFALNMELHLRPDAQKIAAEARRSLGVAA